MSEFVHLHVHSEYSLLDGAARIKQVVKKAKQFAMPALAITDHGSMYGVVEFYKECIANGIKPIIGCEVYVAPQSRFDKNGREQDVGHHLTLLAKDDNGLRNLIKLVSVGHVEGFYYKPRVDKATLRQFASGLIALSGCLAGELSTLILRGDLEQGTEVALEYEKIFGAGNFFLELQNHNLPEQTQQNAGILEIHRRTNIELVATNDVHYIDKQAAEVHDILLCIQTGKKVDDNNRMKFNTSELWLKPYEEMAALFPDAIFERALTNTLLIAERCNVQIEFGKIQLPEYPLPDGKSAEVFLRELCEQAFGARYPVNGEISQIDAQARMQQELQMIYRMGFAGYFLVVWDFINFARLHGIPIGPGRGSAAGSVVSYLLHITNIDPIKHGLLFERFLNPERVTMPDIDTDICYVRRGEVVEYIYQKYGENNVGQVATFGTLAAKQSIKDVGRVLNYSFAEVDRICKLVPSRPGITINEAFAEVDDFKRLYESDSSTKRIIDFALQIEGMPRHSSVHAAGVVITKDELSNYVPVQLTPDGDIVTQYDKNIIEDLGLLKMDLLGLRNLTIIDDTVKLIKHYGVTDFDIDAIPEDDQLTASMLCRGETECVFQLESGGMTQLVKDYQPKCFSDIVPILALYRPATLKSGMVSEFVRRRCGEIDIDYLHPTLEPILRETFGVMLYQEQVMKIANVMAGFSLGQADILRRAMGKKKPEVLAAQRQNFIDGAVKNGYKNELAAYVFELIDKFSGYGFNKSHSAAYAMISYQTAYLKAHYPLYYMAALLSSVMSDNSNVGYYVEICRKMAIKVLPPDINHSESGFSVEADAIRVGLSAIKNVGKAAINSIIDARAKVGKFSSLSEFLQNIDLRSINKKLLESLVYAGAFDSFGLKRVQLQAIMESTLDGALAQSRETANGQMSLFDNAELTKAQNIEIPNLTEYAMSHLLELEKQTVGYYFSGHPLDEFREKFKYLSKIADIIAQIKPDNSVVRVAGIVKAHKRLTTKRGDLMAVIRLEDFSGEIEVVVFPKVFDLFHGLLEKDNRITVCGKISRSSEEDKIIADNIEELQYTAKILKIRSENKLATINAIKTSLANYKGCTPVYIYPINGKMFCMDSSGWVQVNQELLAELQKIVGADYLKVE
ncbi:MAG: DNA polymerase III subunit alpha [Negativicutes bacterium]|jgi:DNA polymerase-3 subunit alpha